MNAEHEDNQRAEMGARLREAREYLGFSQEEVATALGLSRPAITHIEAGNRRVEAIELEKLSKLYGRPVAYFLSGEEENAFADAKVAFAARALQGLSSRDLEEVMRFASYLRNSSRASSRKGK